MKYLLLLLFYYSVAVLVSLPLCFVFIILGYCDLEIGKRKVEEIKYLVKNFRTISVTDGVKILSEFFLHLIYLLKESLWQAIIVGALVWPVIWLYTL